MAIDNQFLTPEEVARILRVKLNTVYQWSSARKIPFIRISSSRILIEASVLARWIEERRIPALGESQKVGGR